MARAIQEKRQQLEAKRPKRSVLMDLEPTRPLTERERIYVKTRAEGIGHTAALAAAGLTQSVSQAAMEARPPVREALKRERELYAQASNITRKQVMDGLLEAVEQAKLQADPQAQIAGWREIGKMCGYYAPEVKRLELSSDARRALQKFEAMSDEELLQLVDADVLEGEAREVEDETDAAN